MGTKIIAIGGILAAIIGFFGPMIVSAEIVLTTINGIMLIANILALLPLKKGQ